MIFDPALPPWEHSAPVEPPAAPSTTQEKEETTELRRLLTEARTALARHARERAEAEERLRDELREARAAEKVSARIQRRWTQERAGLQARIGRLEAENASLVKELDACKVSRDADRKSFESTLDQAHHRAQLAKSKLRHELQDVKDEAKRATDRVVRDLLGQLDKTREARDAALAASAAAAAECDASRDVGDDDARLWQTKTIALHKLVTHLADSQTSDASSSSSRPRPRDSITELGDPAWPSILGGLLNEVVGGEEEFEVANFGDSGKTALADLDRSYISTSIYEDAIDFDADVVVAMLGTNDARDEFWDEEKYLEDYKTLLASFVPATIFVNAPPPYVEYAEKWGDLDQSPINSVLPEILRSLANDDGYGFVDVYSRFSGLDDIENYYDDGIHPNQMGNQLIAEEVRVELVAAGLATTNPPTAVVVIKISGVVSALGGREHNRYPGRGLFYVASGGGGGVLFFFEKNFLPQKRIRRLSRAGCSFCEKGVE
ncbi:hypothetical protein CTAYLR_001994 [Chrysophaeum taylorii]|uniref:SGNH hydrolase-type esterase domain-containing protein n=1 Tax=Chrysophaeum taylorii TaxID=2483200 RepID=A0AAD7U8N3_9STRA|nr:hypothetical protein CTAYLR_001994 [Chrysophaeum taylorii]